MVISDDDWNLQLRYWDAVKVEDDPKSKYAKYRLPGHVGPVLMSKPRGIPAELRLQELRNYARQWGLTEPVVGE